MEKEIKYKKQGDGSKDFPFKDSWTVKEHDSKGNLITAYMVYEDPEKILSSEEIIKLKQLIK